MARPQNSPRGFFAKDRVSIAASGGLYFESYAPTTALLTVNTTSLLLAGSLRLNGQANGTLTGTSSGVQLAAGLALSAQTTYLTASAASPLILPIVTALPSTRVVGGLAFVSNGTGKSLVFHSTGTTWKYATKTSVLA